MKALSLSIALYLVTNAALAQWKHGWYHVDTKSKEPVRLVSEPNNPENGIVVLGTQLGLRLTCFRHDSSGWSVYFAHLPEEKLLENETIKFINESANRVRFSGGNTLVVDLEEKEGVLIATFLADEKRDDARLVPIVAFEFARSPLSSGFADIYGSDDSQQGEVANSDSALVAPPSAPSE